ncbi:MAG: hypothetical protein JSV34_07055, partial [Candidatus Omnitrophota bacterium]
KFYLAVRLAKTNTPVIPALLIEAIDEINSEIDNNKTIQKFLEENAGEEQEYKALFIFWMYSYQKLSAKEVRSYLEDVLRLKDYFESLTGQEISLLYTDKDVFRHLYRWARLEREVLAPRGQSLGDYFAKGALGKKNLWEADFSFVSRRYKYGNELKEGLSRDKVEGMLDNSSQDIEVIDRTVSVDLLRQEIKKLIRKIEQAEEEIKEEYFFDGWLPPQEVWKKINYKLLPQGFNVTACVIDTVVDKVTQTVTIHLKPFATVRAIKHELRAVLFGITHADNREIERCYEYKGGRYDRIPQRIKDEIEMAKNIYLSTGSLPPLRDFADYLEDLTALHDEIKVNFTAQNYLLKFHGVVYTPDISDETSPYYQFLYDVVSGAKDVENYDRVLKYYDSSTDYMGSKDYRYSKLGSDSAKRATAWVNDFVNVGSIQEDCWDEVSTFN